MATFQPISIFTGVYRWSCPDCGHWNENNVTMGVYHVKCKECHTGWDRADALRRASKLHDRPRDTYAALAPMLLPKRTRENDLLNVLLPADAVLPGERPDATRDAADEPPDPA